MVCQYKFGTSIGTNAGNVTYNGKSFVDQPILYLVNWSTNVKAEYLELHRMIKYISMSIGIDDFYSWHIYQLSKYLISVYTCNCCISSR